MGVLGGGLVGGMRGKNDRGGWMWDFAVCGGGYFCFGGYNKVVIGLVVVDNKSIDGYLVVV